MKTVADGNVPARMFYYLLDWNDINSGVYMVATFNKIRL